MVDKVSVRRATKEVTRLWPVWLVTFGLLGIVYAIAPQQIGIIAYKVALIGLGAVAGYWLDRWAFPPIRSETSASGREHAMYRRAALMAAGMLACVLGV